MSRISAPVHWCGLCGLPVSTEYDDYQLEVAQQFTGETRIILIPNYPYRVCQPCNWRYGDEEGEALVEARVAQYLRDEWKARPSRAERLPTNDHRP